MPQPLAVLPLHVKRTVNPTLRRSHSTQSGASFHGQLVADHDGFSAALRNLAMMHDMEVAALKAELTKAKDVSRSFEAGASKAKDLSLPSPREMRPRMPPPAICRRASEGPRACPSAPEPQPTGIAEARLDVTEDNISVGSGDEDKDVDGELEKGMSGMLPRTTQSRPKGTFLSAVVEAARTETYENATRGAVQSKKSRFTNLVTSVGLELLTSFVILMNTVVLGVSTDISPGWRGWAIVDTAFAVFFTIELVLKLCHLKLRTFVLGADKKWHAFETFLVVLAWVEVGLYFGSMDADAKDADSTNVLSLMRVVRLCRITRVIRFLKFEIFLDLVTMIRGAAGGVKTLSWSMVVIGLPLYSIALVFRETLGSHAKSGHGAEAFGTVAESVFTMFRCIVTSDCTDAEGYPIFVLVGKKYGWGYCFFYCLMTLFMMFGLFNVIVAIFVENVISAAKTNDQLLKKQRLRDQVFLADKMVELLTEVWIVYQKEVKGARLSTVKMTLEELVTVCAPMEITPEVFGVMRSKPRIKEIFKDLDVADEDQFNLFETLDADGSGTIDVEELCEGIAKLRGDARRSDMIAVQLMVRNLSWELQALQHTVLTMHSAVGSNPPSNPTSPCKGDMKDTD